jgi:integrase
MLPMTPVYKIKPLASGHLPAWTTEQAAIALGHAPEHLRRVIVLGLYTGQRRGDLCAVRWSDYDGQTLRFTQQKTRTKIVLQVHPDLKIELDSWPQGNGTILANSRGKPWAPNHLSRMLPAYLQSQGLPRGLNIHGMRKLFAAGMADNGATAHEIQASTGHKTLSMVQLYTASADQRKLAEGAVGKIQSHTIARKPT